MWWEETYHRYLKSAPRDAATAFSSLCFLLSFLLTQTTTPASGAEFFSSSYRIHKQTKARLLSLHSDLLTNFFVHARISITKLNNEKVQGFGGDSNLTELSQVSAVLRD